jgi:DNA polymerase-3 subunit alpha
MSDPSGTYEVVLFSEILLEARALLDSGQPLVITVDVRSEEESLRLTTQKIEPLDAVVALAAARLRVLVGEARALSSLKSVTAREAGGRGRVTVVLDLPAREVEIAIPGGFKVAPPPAPPSNPFPASSTSTTFDQNIAVTYGVGR